LLQHAIASLIWQYRISRWIVALNTEELFKKNLQQLQC